MSKSPVRVCITGAAGQIGYSLIPLVCSGKVFGADQPVDLVLLDLTMALGSLSGVVMEIEDCAYPLVNSVKATDKAEEAFENLDYGLFLGAFPRKEGMERKDLLEKNAGIFKVQGEILNRVANKSVKIVVVGNPANTNALILSHYALNIPKENITALTRLDHNRAMGQLAKKVSTNAGTVKNVIIWGNHSNTQFPDASHATIGGENARAKVGDETWLQNDFVKTVQVRGAAVIKARGLSSAMSAANAVAEHMRDWVLGTPAGQWVSMAVVSKGEYGVTEGLVFSYPVQCSNGAWRIVPGLQIEDWARGLMKKTEEELVDERRQALGQ